MKKSTKQKKYFTKHLFGTGIECPTRLYYYSQNYPETKQSIPFIEHAIFNKRLLTALARSVYADGIFVENGPVAKCASQTQQLLDQKEIVLFNGVFEHRRMIARMPVVHKQNEQLTLFHIQVRSFDSRKHRLTGADGHIFSKWRSYLIDFAFQVYLVKQNYPDAIIHPFLIFPEKNGQAFTNYLPSIPEPIDEHDTPITVDAANQELLAKIDVSDLIFKVLDDPSFAEEYLPKGTFEDSLEYLRGLYLNGSKEETEIGLKCKDCEFRIEKERIEERTTSGFNECWQSEIEFDNPSEFHVFDLIGPGTQQWIKKGEYDQRRISPETVMAPQQIIKEKGSLSHEMRQSLQIHKAKGREIPEQIIRPELFEELERWEYPLHFLDFEAGNYAVPIRKKRSPYHLIIFQYSCHTLREDGSWTHHQWIEDSRDRYPNFDLIRALMEVPEIKNGTIVQYSNFERHAMKSIRRELITEQNEIPDADRLIGWIEEIIDRHDSLHPRPPYLADLSRLVKDFYYNSEMENSLSIKDVLRSVMNYSSFLKLKYTNPYNSKNFDDMVWWQPNSEGNARNPYTLLRETGDSPISRGTEAMVVYGKMIAKKMDTETRQAFKQALLKYCELDTLAMVMIYQHWKQEMKNR